MDPENQKLFETLGAQAQQITTRLEDISGTGSDDDELVTATCGPGNRLINIDFDPRSRRLDTHELSEKVITAVQRAGEATQAKMMEIIGDFSGTAAGVKVPGTEEMMKNMEEARAKMEEQRARLEQITQQFKKP
ncbi:YbaB/EbfC family nucleoid-associated protein [Nocardioides jensenii]|uniref:YbaB/EbfC family nucleoid-associated protein n=1 Tax=Nocardioides jensenii TaxID=1843 RepID=UPI0008316A46|nr:YbaB/EbfC family nucleoid-associated protein [Nocardioides jensenii]